MKNFIKLTFCFLFFGLFQMAAIAGAWDCEVTLSGPSVIKPEQTITLVASGDPSGGSYSWWRTPNLTSDGATANLTAFEPTFGDYIRVGITYTAPKGKKCQNVKYIWYKGCCAKISGPDTVGIGETITLSASGEPSGGTFSWEHSNPNAVELDPLGNMAEVTGLAPGNTIITLNYDYPESGVNCRTTHEVKVAELCNITLMGTSAMAVGQYSFITAQPTPEGGTLSWIPHPNIVGILENNIHHGSPNPGIYTYEALYALEGGSSCSSTFDVAFVKVDSISGPYCVNNGSTLFKSDFDIITDPEGYNVLVNVSPLVYSTYLPHSEETVTASIAPGLLDNATTNISIVNSDYKTNSGIEITVPNYISEPLKTLGLSEKLDLKISSNFERFWECCSTFASRSNEGEAAIDLDISNGPFTIAGIPLPKQLKQYITLDVLNVTMGGSGSAKIAGEHKACLNLTHWSGGGALSADVNAGAEAKAKAFEVFVMQGKLSGKTKISQSVEAKGNKLLLSSKWDGLDLIGEIVLQFDMIDFFYKVEYPLIKKKEMPQVSITLPSLK